MSSKDTIIVYQVDRLTDDCQSFFIISGRNDPVTQIVVIGDPALLLHFSANQSQDEKDVPGFMPAAEVNLCHALTSLLPRAFSTAAAAEKNSL